jgi:hypothetical protein
VEKEVNETGKKLIVAYQKKLDGFDNAVGSSLNFSTADLVSGVLSRMKNNAIDYGTGGKMRSKHESTVDSIHKDEVKEYTAYVKKMKEVEETVQDGVKKVYAGKEKIFVGTHQTKIRTNKVAKPRSGPFARLRDKILGMQYEEVDEYRTDNDYVYRDTYSYIPKMVKRKNKVPVVEAETRTETHYVVDVAELQRELITPLRKELDIAVEELINATSLCIDELKKQFLNSFDELDELIKSKYAELSSYSKQQDALKQRKGECENMLEFIQDNLKELYDALNV